MKINPVILMIFAVVISSCSPAETAPTSTSESTAIPTIIQTNTAIPSPTPTLVVTVELVQSITAGPDPLRLPSALAFDEQGNFYVVDSYNQRVVKFDPVGKFLTAWGSEGAGEGQFDFMDGHDGYGGLAVDPEGNVYVMDTMNYRIQKFTSDGRFLLQWGSKGTEDAQFLMPEGVLVDAQGKLYIGDGGRTDIQKFDSTGKFLFKWGGKGTGDGQFDNLSYLAIDGDGNIYVADTYNDSGGGGKDVVETWRAAFQ